MVMPRPLYSRYPLNWRLGGLHTWSGCPGREENLLSLMLAARSPSPQSSYCTDYSVPNPCQRNVNSNVKRNTTNKLSPLICNMDCGFLLASPQNQITRGESDRVFEVCRVCVCVFLCV